jgi:hypothetical protein
MWLDKILSSTLEVNLAHAQGTLFPLLKPLFTSQQAICMKIRAYNSKQSSLFSPLN